MSNPIERAKNRKYEYLGPTGVYFYFIGKHVVLGESKKISSHIEPLVKKLIKKFESYNAKINVIELLQRRFTRLLNRTCEPRDITIVADMGDFFKEVRSQLRKVDKSSSFNYEEFKKTFDIYYNTIHDESISDHFRFKLMESQSRTLGRILERLLSEPYSIQDFPETMMHTMAMKLTVQYVNNKMKFIYGDPRSEECETLEKMVLKAGITYQMFVETLPYNMKRMMFYMGNQPFKDMEGIQLDVPVGHTTAITYVKDLGYSFDGSNVYQIELVK